MKQKAQIIGKKFLSLFLSIVMLISFFAVGNMNVNAMSLSTFNSKVESFKSSRYSNNSTYVNNTAYGGIQCFGFANEISKYIFGSYPTNSMSAASVNSGWTRNYGGSAVDNLKVGSVVRYHGHSIFVTGISGSTIYYCQANVPNGSNKVTYGNTISKSSLKSLVSDKLTLGDTSKTGWVAYHSECPPPIVHIVDSSYSKNFTAYPKAKITASNIFNADHSQYSSTAWIGTSDKCTIHEVYTDGCCKVTYPTSSSNVTAYSKISLFNTTHNHSYSTYVYYEAAHPHYGCYKCSCGVVARKLSETHLVTSCSDCSDIATYTLTAYPSSLTMRVGETKNITFTESSSGFTVYMNGKYSSNYLSIEEFGGWVDGCKRTIKFKAIKEGNASISIDLYSSLTDKVMKSVTVPITVLPDTFSVSYNANGGTGAPAAQTKYYNQSLTLSSTKPIRTGYVFAGWDNKYPATRAYYSSGSSYTDNATVTLYAYWKPIEYIVQYNSNGGSGNMASPTYIYDEAKNLSPNNYTKTGYTFSGWSTSSTATTATYTDCQSVKNLTSTNSVVNLYAVWKPISYTVQYNANGGSGLMAPSSHIYNEAKVLNSNTFTRTGYTFSGWSTSSTATTATYTDCQSVKNLTSTNSVINLYAVWKPINYTVKFDANGGTGVPSNQTKIYGQTLKLSSTQPTKSGYTFLGWATSSSATSPLYSPNGNYTNNAGVTLYAVWDKDHVHTFSTKTYPATCTSDGLILTACDSCGLVTDLETIKAVGHIVVIDKAVAPTCTTIGFTQGNHCSVCNMVLVPQEQIEVLKHNTKETVNKATLSKEGKIETKCTVCGAVTSTKTIAYPKTITLSATSYTYDGKAKKPSVTIKDSKGNKIAPSNYTISYANGCKAVGKYAVKITFKGNYSGTKTLYFTINPKATSISSVTAASKAFTVKWKKQTTQTTGYEIQYATDSKFTKNKKTVTVSKNSTTSKKATGLKVKTKYFVRVRTYKVVEVNGKNTKIYSGWSKVKTVTTKK